MLSCGVLALRCSGLARLGAHQAAQLRVAESSDALRSFCWVCLGWFFLYFFFLFLFFFWLSEMA